MPARTNPSILDSRHDQIFPKLDEVEIERLLRFGEVSCFAAGESLAEVGKVGRGLVVILAGEVDVTRRDQLGHHDLIVTHEPGSFMGELAQLAGRPSLVDAYATSPGRALIISPERLRALLVGEAEIGERIMRALILRRVGLIETGVGGPIIIGRADHPLVLRLEGFLSRNGHPFQHLDPEVDPEAKTLIERFHLDSSELPIVLCPNGKFVRSPSEDELARCLGLLSAIDPERLYDLIVIGAGPAGLATAVYAGSEGLSVLVLDCRAFGGQAGASARIENYLGFPTGISGMALMARAYNQAQKFGVEMAIPDEVASLESPKLGGARHWTLRLMNGESARARAVVIASGARYRRLAIPNLADFEGSSVHYWASPLEAKLCLGQEVALVGGGNSAGQATVYLSGRARKVWLLVRGPSLEANMSRYLIDRISGLANVEVVTSAEVTRLEGSNGLLETVTWRRQGAEVTRPVGHLFLFIGAEPNTDWLKDCGVTRDTKGFILTGEAAGSAHALETSLSGVFAIGDVRSGSVKRVAAAVGEGAQAVAGVHTLLLAAGSPSAPI
ncbi:MAG TPA: FAD-dependent oxidoreductase [Aestuariivirgaceae bacterium]|jgi:thioredoxin reductase (NADPH)|nr:FAD-dependent oxidoreductase [Aestuariivirgaceae bacterium]